MPVSALFPRTSCSAKSATQRASTTPLRAARGRRKKRGIPKVKRRRKRRKRRPRTGGLKHLVQEEMDQPLKLTMRSPAQSKRTTTEGWWPGE